MRTFFDTIKTFIPSPVVFSWDGTAPHLDDASGQLTGLTAYTPPATVTGTSVTAFSAPTGISIRWNTASVVSGHLLRGRTYIVPTSGATFDTTGTIGTTTLASFQTAANAFVTTGGGATDWRFVVWHRPVGGSGGVFGSVLTATIKDVAAVLTSRRD
jgi:hypothetical protein